MEQLPIIQSLWIGDRLSTMERLCIASFLHHGHPFHLYTYDHVENVPEGTTIKDANKIVPSDMIFKYTEHNTYAGFSNIFRYKLLYEKGGYWVDTDNVCLKPFISEAEYIFSSERPEKSENDILQVTNTGVIKTPKGSAIMEYCYNEATSKDKNKLKWGEIGPKLMGSAVKKFGLDSYVATPEKFSTIDWWDWKQFIDGSVDKSILSNAYSVHLWNEMWRRNGIDKDSNFNENSIYQWFKKKYLGSSNVKNTNSSSHSDLVSIIIPCYNQAQYLEEAVRSSIDQTYQNIEIIIVNDGSTDETETVAQKLQNKHPNKIKIITKKNSGLSTARNIGIQKASGEYIVPLDGDDLLHKDMVKHCLNTLKNSDADIIHPDTQLFGLKKEKWIPVQFPKCNPLYRSCWVATSLYRIKVWEKTGGYKKNMKEGYEDMEFWINAYKHGFKFKRCPEILFYYRTKEKSMHTDAKTKDTYLKAKLVLNHPELYPVPYVQESINTIKESEQLADLYFYHKHGTVNDKAKFFAAIGDFLSNNILNEKQVLNILGETVALYSLDLVTDNKSTQNLSKKMNINHLVFFAHIRYEVPFLHNNKYAWKKDEGVIKSEGTIFPFIPKFIQEDTKTQLLAYERLVKYQHIEKNEFLDQINKTKDLQKNMSLHQKNLIKLMNSIKQITLFPILHHPIKKYKAYKLMLQTYWMIYKKDKLNARTD